MTTPKRKDRRLVFGRDYDGWAHWHKEADSICWGIGVRSSKRRPRIQTDYMGRWIRVKIVEVKS